MLLEELVMAKGSAVLKIAGILLIPLGIAGMLTAVLHGFVGALYFDELGRTALTTALILYAAAAVITGFFQIAVGAFEIRHSNKAYHWVRCLIWGIILLILGAVCFFLLLRATGMIHHGSSYYPPWYCFAIALVGGIVLPLLIIIGAVLNGITHKQYKKYKASGALAKGKSRDRKNAGEDKTKAVPEAAGALAATAVPEAADILAEEKTGAEDVVSASSVLMQNAPKEGGRLAYLKSKRMSRNVDPRIRRKFARSS